LRACDTAIKSVAKALGRAEIENANVVAVPENRGTQNQIVRS
jgi:hypothetical protein